MTKNAIMTKKQLVTMLMTELPEASYIKINMAAYDVCAFYAGTFADMPDYPAELVKGMVFKATVYGPMDDEVAALYKKLSGKSLDLPEFPIPYSVASFLFDMLGQIAGVNDFGLVDRAKSDRVYRDTFIAGENNVMPNSEIRNEYQKMREHAMKAKNK